MREDKITAAGGWCAPSDAVYGLESVKRTGVALPDVAVKRGGIDYTQFEPTPEQKAIQEYVQRVIGNIRAAQDAAVEAACAEALRNHWDIYLDRGYDSRFIGIAFKPGRYAIPRIVPTDCNEWGMSFDWDSLYEEDS